MMPSWPGLQAGIALVGYTANGSIVAADVNNRTVTPVFTDFTDRVVSVDTLRGKQYELDQTRAQIHYLVLSNSDGALDPMNAASPFYPQFVDHRAVRVRAYWPITTNLLDANVATGGDTLGTTAGMISPSQLTLSTTTTQAWQGVTSFTSSYPASSPSGLVAWATLTGVAVPGVLHTFSVYAQVSTGSTAYQANAVCYSATGSTLGTYSGTAVALSTTWQRLSVAFTPPIGTVAVAFALANTAVTPASTSTVYTDGLQLERGSAASTWVSPTPVYPILYGYINSIRQRWDAATHQGWVDLGCGDQFGILSQIMLSSVLAQEILMDNPTAYFPLGDAKGATSAGPLYSWSAPSTPTPAPIWGTVPANLTFGNQSIVPGDPTGTSVTLQGNTPTLNALLAIGWPWNSGTMLNSQSTDCSVEFWFQTAQTSGPQRMFAQVAEPYAIQLQISLNASGGVEVVSNGGATTLTVAGTFWDNKPHHVVASIINGNGVLSLILDGTAYAVSRTATPLQSPGWTWLGSQNNLPAFNGSLQHLALYNGPLSTARAQAHHTAGRTGFTGEYTSDRFTRLMNYSGWGGPAQIPTPSYMRVTGLLDCTGQSVLDALQLNARDEAANLYLDGAGGIVFDHRHTRPWQLSPAWTLGEGNGEQPYEAGVEIELDTQRLSNVVKGQRVGGIVLTVADSASIQARYVHTFPDSLTMKYAADADLRDLLNGMLWRYRVPYDRASRVEFDPVSNPALWPFALGARISQRVRLNRRPPGAPTKTLDVWVESVQHALSVTARGVSWRTTIEASPGLPTPLTFATAARSTLATAVTAGGNLLTLVALPDAGTNTSQSNGWTASAMPQVLIWGGGAPVLANVIVMGSTALGYTTFTVTLTAGLATGYPAGTVVSEAMPISGNGAGWTYSTFDVAAAADQGNVFGY